MIKPTIAAIICTRNESGHVQRCLDYLTADGIDVVLIDHGSTDDTRTIIRPYQNHGLIQHHDLAWKGEFSLTEQLECKAQIIAGLHHDWIIHTDTDEWLHSAQNGQTLSDVIQQADQQGFNCLNFNEFAFVPAPGTHVPALTCQQMMLSYYFFQPFHPRLVRAWRRDCNFINTNRGGHLLAGDDVRRFPADQALRHYIVLSQDHAIDKYCNRNFAAQDTDKGWHRNRRHLSPAQMRLPDPSQLCHLSHWQDHQLDISRPLSKHFWHWDLI